MALGTLTKVTAYKDANKRVTVYDVQLTSGANYAAGGETIVASSVGQKKILLANAAGLATISTGATARAVTFLYQTNGDVKMQVQTTGSAEAAGSSDQSTFTVRIRFEGT
jgi:hypothetical protein